MRRATLVLAVWIATLGAVVPEDPAERQMLAIAAQLRCAVCQNESVAESHAQLAQDMRALIREQLAAGRSEAQILAWFHDRYGDYVLMRPPARGSGWLLWLGPSVLLAVGGTGAFLFLRRRARAGQGAA